LDIFIGSSRAAHENRDKFIAFGNRLWYPAAMAKPFAGNHLVSQIMISRSSFKEIFNQSEFNNHQSSIVNQKRRWN
jgi:hypothetical protein